MKQITYLSILCCLMVAAVGCRQQEPERTDSGIEVPPPPPPHIVISGTVTNEENLPLEAIQISINGNELNVYTDSEEGVWLLYSDEQGNYLGEGVSNNNRPSAENLPIWPSEITITAQDASGVYEAQTNTFPVESVQRFPEELGQYQYYMDANVTANFVMKAKK